LGPDRTAYRGGSVGERLFSQEMVRGCTTFPRAVRERRIAGVGISSQLSGLGRPFDVSAVVLRSAWPSSDPTLSMVAEWFRIRFFALIAYYYMYCAPAFLTSVLTGLAISRGEEKQAES
jgi:hypothetical protein